MRYAYAAAATDNAPLGALLSHHSACLDFQQTHFPHAYHAVVIVDEIVRREWARRATLNEASFVLSNEAGNIPSLLVDSVRSLLGTRQLQPAIAEAAHVPFVRTDVKGGALCSHCGGTNHHVSKCFALYPQLKELEGKGGEKGAPKAPPTFQQPPVGPAGAELRPIVGNHQWVKKGAKGYGKKGKGPY